MKILSRSDYVKVCGAIYKVNFNKLFTKSVVNLNFEGKIFVDDLKNPQTFYIIHPYGMSLLVGESNNASFNKWLKDYSLNITKKRTAHEWMQAYPAEWDIVLPDLFGEALIKSADNVQKLESGIIERNTRINFRFDPEKFSQSKLAISDPAINIRRTDAEVFRTMPGTVVPAHFWKSEEDFLRNGVGFSLYYNDQIASTVYSAFIMDNQLELGIETVPEFRGKGFAQLVCQSILEYCIERHLEPIWACRLENTGSYILAQKLGFVPSREIPYYRLSK